MKLELNRSEIPDRFVVIPLQHAGGVHDGRIF